MITDDLYKFLDKFLKQAERSNFDPKIIHRNRAIITDFLNSFDQDIEEKEIEEKQKKKAMQE